MTLNLRQNQMKITIFLYPYRRYRSITRFHQIIQTKNTVSNRRLPSFNKHYNILHFIKGSPINKLTFQLFYILMMLEYIQNMFMLHQLFLQITIWIPRMGKLHPHYLTFLILLWQFDMQSYTSTRKDNHTCTLGANCLRLQFQRFASWD